MAVLLLVEDDEDTRASVTEVLECAVPGLEVTAFGDAETALAWLLDHGPDLMLVDYRLPGMDGGAFLARAAMVRPEATAVLMTGLNRDPSTAEACRLPQVRGFVGKPMAPFDLVRAIVTALEPARVTH